MIGQTIAHYKVTAKLGAGGMGEVYRATDTKLNRDVALKVLPQAFASDEQRMVRFEREAQVLASLNHAHIATIHGLEESGATRALVMELVEGPTLAERIARGAIPLEEAVAIATQIAEGLEYAHEHNVIHRDLKPANIKLTNDGQVKILDFGLAKALEGETSAQDLSTSPTISMAATRAGIILGTAAYMSPEQARGTPVDKRCDIWSFGVVLFEMLTGKQIFSGETASDTLAAVLRADLEWSSLPVATPPAIRQLLERCLKRDRKQRLRDIGDARMQLEEAMSGAGSAASGVTPGVVSPVRTQIPWLAIGATAAVTLALSWIAFRAIAPTPVNLQATPVRLALRVPSDWSVEYEDHSAVAITNDGRKVAYSARKKGGERMLHLRSLDKLEDTVLAGTEDALDPFFSPDGLWIGFFANGRLKKISATGGLPIQLMEGTDDRGATWAEDDFIYYSPAPNSSVFRIPAAGGPPTPVTKLANDSGEQSHRWAQLLPGGKTILYTVKTTSLPTFDEAKIVVETLATHERQTVLEGGSHSVYVPSGHILFTRAGTLYAVPFDVGSLKVRGAPTKIVDGVATDGGTGASSYAVPGTGTLVNVSGGS
ncbi:MAG: serine/threonine protein kinase, partial [Acidobacteria bacterium]|nr:serine/threonine protein kinase [Acidobacteriota bacterium]